MQRTEPSNSAGTAPPGAGGFTLLEVLAAVAILAIWYMVMASIATQGLRAEGESQRRLRASLLADSLIVDLESNQILGIAPPVQEEEEAIGEFVVRTLVEPYRLEFPRPPDDPNPNGPPEAALQKLVQGSGESLLLTVRVEVRWWEGVTERVVSRETFALDLVPVLADLANLAPEEAVEEDEGDDADPTVPGTGDGEGA